MLQRLLLILSLLTAGADLRIVPAVDRIDPEVDSALEQDPCIPNLDPVPVVSERLKSLWLEALAQPEIDVKRLVAASIARAQRAGATGLADFIPALTAEVDRPAQHRLVQLACAQALVDLDARQSAAILRTHAVRSLEIALVVEPALALWDDAPAREMWLARLQERDVRIRRLLLAIDGLAAVRDRRAAERLIELALERSGPPDVRLRAAAAAARLRDSGLEQRVRPLLSDTSRAGLTGRLVAASLLARHHGPAAQALWLDLAADDEPAVAAIALQSLLETAPDVARPLALQAVRRDDPHVRKLAAAILIAGAAAEHIVLVGTLLDDVHPEVRRFVRRALIRAAGEPLLAELVSDAAMRQLSGESWRGQEQAIFVIVAQNHRPAIPRLVELMESERLEVLVTAAWALRRLKAREALPQMLARAQHITDLYLAQGGLPVVAPPGFDRQLGQLFEAFGEMKCPEADTMMRRHIRRNPSPPPYTRARAIWALGHLHAEAPNADLSTQFSERLADAEIAPPEFEIVRQAAAVSLGRMKAEVELPVLRRYDGGPVGYACQWAIHQITGEPIPEIEPLRQETTWFLTPLD
ncbi:MAG TPA: hypothetical protein VML55_18170 [Planctomycetaceae bacterium]|nr:hypothetical protein [Planctomycetaceae bacterium]